MAFHRLSLSHLNNGSIFIKYWPQQVDHSAAVLSIVSFRTVPVRAALNLPQGFSITSLDIVVALLLYFFYFSNPVSDIETATLVDLAPEQKGQSVMDALLGMFTNKTSKAEALKKGMFLYEHSNYRSL